jgi:hypothetical protein
MVYFSGPVATIPFRSEDKSTHLYGTSLLTSDRRYRADGKLIGVIPIRMNLVAYQNTFVHMPQTFPSLRPRSINHSVIVLTFSTPSFMYPVIPKPSVPPVAALEKSSSTNQSA